MREQQRAAKNLAIHGIVISNEKFFSSKVHARGKLIPMKDCCFLPLYQGKLRIWPIALDTIGKYRFLFSGYAVIIKVVHM